MALREKAALGMSLPHRSPDPLALTTIGAVARRAEELGFRDLWVTENTVDEGTCLDPVVALTFAASITKRIGIGAAVIVLPIHHPLTVANQWATLDFVSGGRAILAVGLGRTHHYRDFEVPVERRVRRFREEVELIRALWTEDKVTYRGEIYQVENVRLATRPVRKPHPPLWMGVGHPDAVRRAATLADGWMGSGGSSIAEFKASVPILKQALEAAGRDPAKFPVSKRVFMAVDERPAVARAELNRWFTDVYHNPPGTDASGIHGTPEQVRERLEDLVAAGANHLLLNPISRHAEQLEAVAELAGLQITAAACGPDQGNFLMPFGGNDWLALTQEPALEPELPICDPHHHFWDFRTTRIPYQRYLLHELADDICSGHNVRSTVFIEARAMYRADGPEEMRPVGEVEFVQGLAAASASGLYGPGRAAAAIVGHANLLLGDRVTPVLEALQAASPNRFRGIRHSVTWDPHPEVENTAAHRMQGQLGSEPFRAGARVLARMGLSLEGWMYFPQLPELADFAKAVPDLPIILNHIGGLLRTGPYANKDEEVLATWRRGIAAVAACPNVTIKLGGIGMPRTGFDWHLRQKPIGSEELAAAIGPFMTYCIEQFAPSRCMFESNFPVDKVSFSYQVMYNAFKRLSKSYTPTERAQMFHDTAVRTYRVPV